MKHFNRFFDIIFYESIFIFLFSGVLYLLDDPISDILFMVSFSFGGLALVLGLAGRAFRLFSSERDRDF